MSLVKSFILKFSVCSISPLPLEILGKLPVPGRSTIWMIVGQGPIALAVGASGDCLDIFTLLCLFSLFSPALSGRWRDID